MSKLGALLRRVDLQGAFTKKSAILLNLKVFLWNSQGTGAPAKIKSPRKSPDKRTFLSVAFYNAPSLHTVDKTLGPLGL